MANTDEKKVILAVDDEPQNLEIAYSILKDTYKVRIATNGEKAIELAVATPHPDLILLDVMMPGINGYEVCARLKENAATKDIPVIFLTGQTEVAEETKGFAVGAADYIHKPFSPLVVQARVNMHMSLRTAQKQIAEQLKRIHEEMECARNIQLSIIPREVPKLAGLDIAARYIPMTAVAGDFYDFIVPDDKHVGVLVADVSGHGMPAALISSMLKIAFHAQEQNVADPSKVLDGLNQTLCGKFSDHFVTAAYVYLDLEKKVLRYAGAGHPPILIGSDRNGEVRRVEENGLILSFMPVAQYASVELPLNIGDRVVLYTDGIVETANVEGEFLGIEGVEKFLSEHGQTSSDELAGDLLTRLLKWSGRPENEDADDDITLVVAQIEA
ncbi:response regulator receiver modulated serine phosphatase [Candidatus Koribacter versatilis Ellin345]|uniref:Response regulator receiver modulated serine phosphatase n=1 Tax=Koribacter versatilis (strain Ellin345) TaxID=204669 RepID=Q1IMF3_KORVE|nr:SpoIIE family protein phosphatase [Candidatus Koribacter versatilis]ABF41947.1 response regulator receiver modulated serine phosphatase [Candidatus Koribacter versatilis Ellin345]